MTSQKVQFLASSAYDPISKRISLDDALIALPESTYFLQVTGDAMRDAGITDGDYLVVESYGDPQHGDIVIVA